MTKLSDMIGKKFKCSDPHFLNEVGTILDAWVEEGGAEYFNVMGSDWQGTFRIDEGEIV